MKKKLKSEKATCTIKTWKLLWAWVHACTCSANTFGHLLGYQCICQSFYL